MKTYLFVLIVCCFAFNSCKKTDLGASTTTSTGCNIQSVTTYDSINKAASNITMQYDSRSRLTKFVSTSYNGAITETDVATYNDDKRSVTITVNESASGIPIVGTRTVYFDDNGNAKSLFEQFKTGSDPSIAYDTTYYTYNSDRYLIAETSDGGTTKFQYFNGNRISSTSQEDSAGVTILDIQTLYEFSNELNNIPNNNYSTGTFFYKTGLENKNLITKITNKYRGVVFSVQTYTDPVLNSMGYPTFMHFNRVGLLPVGISIPIPFLIGTSSNTTVNFTYTCN